tara:strand:- start:335 stop:991 length:657 start_codon:yes stop_codon:yes gene_type:complete
MARNRNIRRLINTKEDSIGIQNNSSLNSMVDGQLSMSKNPNKPLTIYRKKFGRLWKSYMSADGNDIIDKNLKVGNDINVNGTIYGNQIYWFNHNYSSTETGKHYLGWGRATTDTSIGVHQKFVAPYDGKLLKVLARTESAGGSSVMGFHKASNTTTDPSGTATEEITVDMSAADTTYEFEFTATSKFNKGDVIALSIDPTNALNDSNYTSILSFDIKM